MICAPVQKRYTIRGYQIRRVDCGIVRVEQFYPPIIV
jgi:hypothetical protein